MPATWNSGTGSGICAETPVAPALYQTKPSNARIMRTLIISLAAKSETVHTVTTFRAGSNTLGLLNTSLSKLGKTMPALVIDRYENFHLTDVDMLLIAYTDTDTDQKKTNSPIPIRRKRNSPIPIWKIIRYRYWYYHFLSKLPSMRTKNSRLWLKT